eukprot:Skav234660  [mRNA]  locus=scaffold1131:235893:236621:- [translate_table: standard]
MHEATILTKLQDEVSQPIRCFFPCMFEMQAQGCPFPFLVMEYFGTSVSNLLRSQQSPLDLEDCKIIAVQLQAALRALHELHILHLDVKTSNILWSRSQRYLKLADFGMAEFRFPATGMGTSTMRFAEYVTNLYRAPELWDLESTKELTTCLKPAVDMWSYGCVVYEVATAQILMRGLHARSSAKGTVQCWCQNWFLISENHCSTCVGAIRMRQRMAVLHNALRPIVLAALNPDPARRTWSGI